MQEKNYIGNTPCNKICIFTKPPILNDNKDVIRAIASTRASPFDKAILPFNIIMENPAKDKKTPRRRNRPGFFLRFHQLLSGSKQIKCFIRL